MGSSLLESPMMGTFQIKDSFDKKKGGKLYEISIVDIVTIKCIAQAG